MFSPHPINLSQAKLCRACGDKNGYGEICFCDSCYIRLEQSAKIRSKVIREEHRRIREHNFSDEEISFHVASIISLKSDEMVNRLRKSIRSKEEAYDVGLKTFYTGEPCINGHISERFVKNNKCCECRLEYHRKYRVENPDRSYGSGRPSIMSRLSLEQRNLMYKDIGNGMKTKDIAKKYKCHRGTVLNIRREIERQ